MSLYACIVLSRSRYTTRVVQEQVSTEPALRAPGAKLLLLELACVVVFFVIRVTKFLMLVNEGDVRTLPNDT